MINDKNIKFIELTCWSAHSLDVCDVTQLEGLVTRHDGHVGGGVTLGVQVYTAKSETLICICQKMARKVSFCCCIGAQK